MKGFASDNNASVHPAVLRALARANAGHAAAYGDDDWTRRAERLIARELGRGARLFLTLNGTCELLSVTDGSRAKVPIEDLVHAATWSGSIMVAGWLETRMSGIPMEPGEGAT